MVAQDKHMPEIDISLLFIPLLFTVAFLYASVGHGGASGYLALMALFSFQPYTMRPSALILNIFVSLIAFFQYWKGGHFKPRLFFPFIITSIPASFLGAYISIDALVYKKILGILLIFPILRLLGAFGKEHDKQTDVNLPLALLAGAIIGLFSGMIGIGGGIILSPIILLMHWGNMKETAAVSALFIAVNSVSGLIGLYINGLTITPDIYLWIAIAIAGGTAGSYLARTRFNNRILKTLLAVVLLLASIKLMLT